MKSFQDIVSDGPYEDVTFVLRETTNASAIGYYIESLNPKIRFICPDTNVNLNSLLRLMASGKVQYIEQTHDISYSYHGQGTGIPDIVVEGHNLRMWRMLCYALSTRRLPFTENDISPHVDPDNRKLVFSATLDIACWSQIVAALSNGFDVMIPYADFFGGMGHQLFLYMSVKDGKRVEIWDPEGKPNPFIVPLIQKILDSIKLDIFKDFEVVTMESLFAMCPNTGKYLGPQELQVLENKGFRGSCMVWNIWLMSLRAAKGPISKEQFAFILDDIRVNHTSLTNFIVKFARFFKDNETELNNREEMLERIRSNKLFFNCIQCNERIITGLCGGPCKTALYCSNECAKRDWPNHKKFCKSGSL